MAGKSEQIGELKLETAISKSKSPESSSDDMSSESHGSEPEKATDDMSEDGEDEFTAEMLQNGFFYFCENFREAYISELRHSYVLSLPRRFELIDALNALDGKTGVGLWTSMPEEVGIVAATRWFKLSKPERATYIAEGTKAYETATTKKKSAEWRSYVEAAYYEEFLENYREKSPNDPASCDLAGKTGRELVEALAGYTNQQIFSSLEEFFDDKGPQVSLCVYSLLHSLPPRKENERYLHRAKTLRDEDLMKAFKKKLEEAAKAEQDAEEAAKDRKTAFICFCEEYYYDEGEVPTEDVKDAAYDRYWLLSPEVRDAYVDKAKEQRVMMKRKQAGAASGLISTSKEDLDLEMDAFREKAEDAELFVESAMIHLPSKMVVSSNGTLHAVSGEKCFIEKYVKDHMQNFPDHTRVRAERLADESWENLPVCDRVKYLAMARKDVRASVKRAA